MRFSCTLSEVCEVTLGAGLTPADLMDVVPQMGDRYRDDFTRAVLYLANRYGGETREEDCVVLASRYGNLESMVGLSRLAIGKAKRISAQIFPNATTSSAATYANIERGASGANVTLNAGDANPITALFLACSDPGAGRQHVFVGDAASETAREDLSKRYRDEEVPRATHVAYVGLGPGTRDELQFSFGEDASRVLEPLDPATTEVCRPGDPAHLDQASLLVRLLSADRRALVVVAGSGWTEAVEVRRGGEGRAR